MLITLECSAPLRGEARKSNRKAWPRDRARAAKTPQYPEFDFSLTGSIYLV
jgi:hypothetical protein